MESYYLEANKDYHNKEHSLEADDTLLEDTVQYYEDCHNDYLFAWCNRQNLALHYGYWDEATPYDHHQALLNTNRILYETANIKPSEHILDAGCGLGGSSLWIADEYKNKVTGITLSEKQALYANRHAAKRGLTESVNFEVANFCATDFPDASFDVVWALESACYALDKADFLQEAYRLLRKGGRLVLCDAFMLRREFNAEEWQTVMNFLNGWAVPNLASRDEFNQLLSNTGFQSVQCTDISEQVLPSSKHMYKVAKRLYPIQKVSQFLKLRSKTQTENYEVSFAQYDFFHQRLAEYCIFTATK